MKKLIPDNTKIPNEHGDLKYSRMVNFMLVETFHSNLEIMIQKVRDDFNNGACGVGKLYDYDTGVVWSICNLDNYKNDYDKSFENKVINDHFPENEY